MSGYNARHPWRAQVASILLRSRRHCEHHPKEEGIPFLRSFERISDTLSARARRRGLRSTTMRTRGALLWNCRAFPEGVNYLHSVSVLGFCSFFWGAPRTGPCFPVYLNIWCAALCCMDAGQCWQPVVQIASRSSSNELQIETHPRQQRQGHGMISFICFSSACMFE